MIEVVVLGDGAGVLLLRRSTDAFIAQHADRLVVAQAITENALVSYATNLS
ncbi:hypothetical protein ACIPX0_31710 [Streptomyces sp. NPDC090075]|uniref:hypothetical protein n=1 Tax=Streptomyces sp. NPDC090075 TaxID=3365937 RepID=UPI00381337E8